MSPIMACSRLPLNLDPVSVQASLTDPTLRRLLRLVEVVTALDRRDEVLALEAGRAAAGPPAQRSNLAVSLLLAGPSR